MFFNKSGNCFLPWNVTLFYRSLLDTRDLWERQEKRQAAILDAARRLFQRYGYKNTTMDEIAAEAGITKPTV